MKTIGLIGGMPWDSTATYYTLVNRAAQARLGGLHSAQIAMISLDFAEPERLARTADWDRLAALLIESAGRLERAGAGLVVLCANTAHRVAARVEEAVGLPLIDIRDAAAAAVRQAHCRRAALLGTRYTMEEDFFTGRLRASGLDVVVPDADDRTRVHRAIEGVWRSGGADESGRAQCRAVIARLIAAGVDAVILGCTELPLLVRPEDSSVPLFDTTALHAEAAVAFAMD